MTGGERLRLATTWTMRVRGLLGTRARGGEVLLIAPCWSIHTVGMRYSIDVAFVDRGGMVMRVVRGMRPGKRARCRGAVAVFERCARPGAWFRAGDAVTLGNAAEGTCSDERGRRGKEG